MKQTRGGSWSERRSLWLRAVTVFAAIGVPWQIGLAQVMLSPVQGSMSLQTGVVQPEPETAVNSLVRNQASQRFLRGRVSASGTAGAGSLAAARAEHASMVRAQGAQPPTSALNATWQPVGPGQVASVAYGKISGRISSIAIDPADRTGSTVYLGTTGGGVWKSTNAAGPAESVTFAPMTDNLPVFSGSVGSSATASLSIGAISVQAGGIVLAGTGDPNDALDSYYGSGILRSADSGLTWTLAPNSLDGATGRHYFSGLGFAGFAWSTNNPNLVVAAVSESAEGRVVHASTTDSVMGLYVSGDAGATWQMATISDGPQIIQTPMPSGANQGGMAATAVVWNPKRQRFYAVVRYHGYYESSDGTAWVRLATQPGTAMTSKACPPAPGTSGSSACPVFRGTIAVQPDTGDMFALTTDRNNVDQGLWQDVCGLSGNSCTSPAVTFGKRIASTALDVGSGNAAILQADYNMSLTAVSVGADTLLFVGTSDLYRCSLAAGCVLRNTTNAINACTAPAKVGPAQHAIAALGTTSMLFLGNDSGLWRSVDDVNEQGSACSTEDASHFQNLNGGLGSLAEVISFAQDPQDPASLLVGLGANGTASSFPDRSGAWQQLSGGEGGTVAIDQSNPLLWYISTAAGVSIHQCSMGIRCAASDFAGVATIGATQTNTDASLLDAPWILDPVLNSSVLIGTCRVWRGPAASGDQWSSANQISTTLGGPQNRTCDPTTNPFVRSLAAGGSLHNAGTAWNSGSQVVYAGMAGLSDGGGAFAGHVFATLGADVAANSTRWTDLAHSTVTNDFSVSGRFNPNGFDISSLAADSHDVTGKTIYATVMGFSQSGASAAHLYGSTDGGAHWLNLSSNLPNAPANSVIVDPNDANTIYVALDTGVYVTSAISSCTTSSCWSIYGASLPNAPAVQLSAAALMPTGDGRTGLLRVGTYGRGIWEIPLLTAGYAAKPAISLSPASLSFSDQAAGTASSPQTIQVTNIGNAALVVSHIVVAGEFTITDHCAGAMVAVGASCSVEVQFLPANQGVRAGLLTIYANVSGGQATATLAGNATAPGDIVLTPLAVTFPTTTINATSAAQNLTISNVGSVPVKLQPPSITGEFRISANTCGTSLAASTGCTVSLTFNPTAGGTRSGSFTVTASSGTQTASLTGIATSPATDSLSPSSLIFDVQQLGTASPVQQVVLTNVGDVALTLIAAEVRSGDFTAVNGCGNSLNAHSTCSISVAYTPKRVGAGSGVLTVSDQFRLQTVHLNGTGVAPPGVSLSPLGEMAFPDTPVGVSSLAQIVVLTNNGGLPLALKKISLTGDFVFVPGGTCGGTLAQNTACTFQIAFVPAVGGVRSGGLVILDDAPNAPHTVALTGAGVDFSLAADSSTSAAIASGKVATYSLLLSALGNTSGVASFTCSGAPVNATCVVSPGNAPLGPATLVTVTVATGVSSTAQMVSPPLSSRFLPVLLAGLFPIGALFLRERRAVRLVGLLVFVCVAAGEGCGSGRLIPSPGDVSPIAGAMTPPGNYTLTVAATASGLTRTMALSLTIK